ncbi:MAG: efflux RND transporter permease subunit [Paludibacteraceae bacterium]|nr:efflux RND transporter permease subunit [Paludibacteraceae bacterium]
MSKRDHIQGALRNHGIIFFVFGVLMAFGIWALPQMSKDEFPQFTIRQAVVAAIYPGATAEEVEQQVTVPLEAFINSYEEVNRQMTYSTTEDGVVYCYVMLRNSITSKDQTWAKMRAGLNLLKKTKLPAGVADVVLIDDFGNTASILLSVESNQRSVTELQPYAERLTRQLSEIDAMGKLKILGSQREQIVVTLDLPRMASYGLTPSALQAQLLLQGLRTVGGQDESAGELRVDIPYSSEYEIARQIIRTDPLTGAVLRLQDVATVERRLPKPEQFVRCYTPPQTLKLSNPQTLKLSNPQTFKPSTLNPQPYNTPGGLIISMEMEPGNNIVAFGESVQQVLDEAALQFPPDIRLHRVTDQPKVVDDSVRSFLRDILISILVVIAVMLLLFPLRTALVACTGVPVCIAICIGLMYLTGIELNTVTLAALIFVLGMIVDDSVIVIDGYTNLLDRGWSRWYSATVSTRQLFVPMSLATCAIAGMFFPMTRIITGPLGEFVQLFPFAVLFALGASIFYAAWMTPYLSTQFIRRRGESTTRFEKGQELFFTWLQRSYDRLLSFCFRHRWFTYGLLIAALGSGVFFLTRLNLQLLPKAEREMFAVEIHLAQGSTVDQTAALADSLARMLVADSRVLTVTSFVGHSSPRFHATYTPAMPAPNYAQFVVGTADYRATAELLRELGPRYEHWFPNAYVRFKQLDYQVVKNPLEVRLAYAPFVEAEEHEATMQLYIDSIRAYMASRPELVWVHSDYDDIASQSRIVLKADEASRLGVTQASLSLYLASVTRGVTITNIYEHGNTSPTPVVLCSSFQPSNSNAQTATLKPSNSNAQTATLKPSNSEAQTLNTQPSTLNSISIPTATGTWVPLRQVADIVPAWHHASIEHRNGVPTITIGADLVGATSQVAAERTVSRWLDGFRQRHPTDALLIRFGGLSEINGMIVPQILWSVVAALLVMFVLLLYHFGRIRLALLALSSAALCMFGAMLGLWLFRLDISITAVLGTVSLIGIIVRNAIMMYEYAEELRHTRGLSVSEAAYEAGRRRMRPVFLTSATTALGVLPMIIAHTSLWMPMGVVICFGTIFTLPLTLTILPVLYARIIH